MNMNTEIEKLSTSDIYSLMLFALYKLKDTKEYSALSQLAYILDKEDLLKLCQFFGGLTITIPTIEELNEVLNALLLFQKVDIEKQDFKIVLGQIRDEIGRTDPLVKTYAILKNILSNYRFNTSK